MSDIVNLRQARKQKARSIRGAQAEANRARFGRSKTERQKDAAVTKLSERRLDGARRETLDKP